LTQESLTGSTLVLDVRVLERDVDLLLAEEFSVSLPFAEWFLTQLKMTDLSGLRVNSVTVSKVHHTFGETDLEVVFERTEFDKTKLFAVLIEDKITAPLQAEQIRRYRSRGDEACKGKEYEDYFVVLCAPDAYGTSHLETDKFDKFISYEMIADYLKTRSDDNLRDHYRADFLTKYLHQGFAPAKQTLNDPATNAFWNSVYEIATSEFSELEMKVPKFAKGRTWAHFRSQGMPRKVCVCLLGEEGRVELAFANALLQDFQIQVASLLEDGMTLHKNGLTTVIRLQVRPLRIPDLDKDKTRKALAACTKLVDFYKAHQDELDQAAAKSPLNP
jgi:hypothetical protein